VGPWAYDARGVFLKTAGTAAMQLNRRLTARRAYDERLGDGQTRPTFQRRMGRAFTRMHVALCGICTSCCPRSTRQPVPPLTLTEAACVVWRRWTCLTQMNYADIILDLVSTGTTLRENNLKELEGAVIMESEGVLVARRTALLQQPETLAIVREMLERVEAHLKAEAWFTVRTSLISLRRIAFPLPPSPLGGPIGHCPVGAGVRMTIHVFQVIPVIRLHESAPPLLMQLISSI
jgi:hypothetical protein